MDKQALRDRVLRAEGGVQEVAARIEMSKSYVALACSRRQHLGEDTSGVPCSQMQLKLNRLEHVMVDNVDAVNDLTVTRLETGSRPCNVSRLKEGALICRPMRGPTTSVLCTKTIVEEVHEL